MNGVIYCRVSSKEQIEGTSLESQEVSCREFARTKGIEILKVFVEQGESAKFADRTQLLSLIDFCRDNKSTVNVLLVWKVDRFARNVSDHFSVKATLGKYGVRIVSVTEPIDANPEGRLMETILAGFAQFDNDIRAARTVQGMRRKLEEGIFPWGPPWGYKSSVLNREKKTLPDLPDEPTFSLLKKAWQMFATSAHTQAEMARLMLSWGLTNARGGLLAPQTIYQLFTNPYYAGILVNAWTGEEHIGKHVPMVTREEFERVQRVIRGGGRSVAHQTYRPEFPIRGLVCCTDCRQALTAGFSRGRSAAYPYYWCHTAGCAKRGKSYSAEAVHNEFFGFLDEITPRPEILRKLGERVIRYAAKDNAAASDERRRAQKQLSKLEAETQELIRMRTQRLISDQEFVTQKRSLLDQKVAYQQNQKKPFDSERAQAELDDIVEPLAALKKTWHKIQPPFRRRFERIILPGGYLIENIRTADLGLLFSSFRGLETTNSSGVPPACLPLNHFLEEIRGFSEVMNGVEMPKPEPKRRFENSHRSRLRWRSLNQRAA